MSTTEKLLKKKRDPLSNVFDEMDVFKKLPSCGMKDDVLKWWAEHSNILPRLSVLARWILAVPAGTASSERLFSIVGLFDTVRRGNMNMETFELLTLLKSNKKAIDKFSADLLEDSSDDDDQDVNQNIDSDPKDPSDEEEESLTFDEEMSDSSSEEESDEEEDCLIKSLNGIEEHFMNIIEI